MAQEFDVCESERGEYVGGLQLLLSNEGRKISDQSSSDNDKLLLRGTNTSPSKTLTSTHKHKKKILSKPIENISTVIDQQLVGLAQAYEFTKTNVGAQYQSEEARKKLRVERLRKQTVLQPD